MSDLEDLYQEVIMEHNLKPRNFTKIEDSNRFSEGFNPFCGDTIHIYVKIDGNKISDVGFQGSGCAISRASASMMTEVIKGKTTEETDKLLNIFHGMNTSIYYIHARVSYEKNGFFANCNNDNDVFIPCNCSNTISKFNNKWRNIEC